MGLGMGGALAPPYPNAPAYTSEPTQRGKNSVIAKELGLVLITLSLEQKESSKQTLITHFHIQCI